jgi:ankyrin repeat protein
MRNIAFCAACAALAGVALITARPGFPLVPVPRASASSSVTAAIPSDLNIDASGKQQQPPAIPEQKTAAELAAAALQSDGLDLTVDCYLRSARQGSVAQIELFLAAGMPHDSKDEAGRTALLIAAETGNLPMLRRLIGAGADVNGADNLGTTPLIAAAVGGTVTVIEELVARGAKLNATDLAGQTALMRAIRASRLPAANTLLALKPDLSLRDNTGADAFIHALTSLGDCPLSRALLAAGEPRPQWSAATREVLFTCIRARDSEGVRLYLRSHAVQPTLGEDRQTVLAYTIAWGDLEQLRLLLDAGADPNVVLTSPVEGEFIACFQGKMLPNYLSEEKGLTPLMLAAGMGRTDLVEALLAKGARPGAVTAKFKIAPLIFAAWAKDIASQLLLLGRSPRIDEQPMRIRISLSDQRAYVYKDGEVALVTAVSTGRPGFRTPTGDFVVTDKHLTRMSSLYKVPMPFFMRLSCSEVGMHAGVVPGYPASHGCIRMPREKVRQLYRLVEIGTPVSIVN